MASGHILILLQGCQQVCEKSTQLISHQGHKWVQDNNMRLNEDKFEALRYGRHPAQQIIYKTGILFKLTF